MANCHVPNQGHRLLGSTKITVNLAVAAQYRIIIYEENWFRHLCCILFIFLLGRVILQPDFKAIKKRIEDLITRDYLERDKDNANMYKYLA